MAAFTAAAYLLNTRTMMALTEAADTDAKTKARIQFAVEQWAAAAAPSNYLALNAEAQQKAIDTKGESISKGIQNLLHDMQQGHVSMTDESLFEVGKNVATTEGKVVFENEFFQLLEYKPLTAKVYERPFLFIPPCINKFYILDLQPENSFIRYAVAQGHRTFVVSWRNPDESLRNTTWDNYVEDVAIQAIKVVQEIGGAKQINALGFCVGGTILSNALAVLAARGEKPVASATLLTTLIDFTDTGVLDVFIDEAFVKFREGQFARGGLMKGKHRHRLTCSTGTATPPTCPAPCMPGICATPILRTTLSNRAKPRCVAKRLTCAKLTCLCTSTARAKITSCRSVAHTPARKCSQGRSVLSWVHQATLRA
jgi:polyhydroxyalkanoate synthase